MGYRDAWAATCRKAGLNVVLRVFLLKNSRLNYYECVNISVELNPLQTVAFIAAFPKGIGAGFLFRPYLHINFSMCNGRMIMLPAFFTLYFSIDNTRHIIRQLKQPVTG